MAHLLELARRQFGSLSGAELKLLQTATAGECDGCDRILAFDPLNDPAEADAWGDDRKIRASLIRWACITG